MRLWAFATAAWERPGVADACLHLQDHDGQCVGLLLWRAWTVGEGRAPAPLGDAVDLARRWETGVIAPLRAARRGLSSPSRGLAEADREALYARVRALELDAERRMLEGLEAATPDPVSSAAESLPSALTDLALAWSGVGSPVALAALTDALGQLGRGQALC